MSLYQYHFKAYKNTHTSSHQFSEVVGKAVCQSLRKLGTEGSYAALWEAGKQIFFRVSHNNKSNV